MGIFLNPGHIKRYKDIGYLFFKYGGADLVKGMFVHEPALWSAGLEANLVGDARDGGNGGGIEQEIQRRVSSRASIEELPADLEALGPTFIEAGRWLAAHPGYLPPPYLEALSRTGKNLVPMPIEEVRAIIERELAIEAAHVFEHIDVIPVSVSAIEQTHLAILQGGKRVVMKVQRPDIREQVLEDLDSLVELASTYDQYKKSPKEFEFRSVVEEFSKTILAELDYRQEAHNLRALQDNLKDLSQIVVPQPLEQYSTQHVLCINYVKGKPLEAASTGGLLRSERKKLAGELWHAYLKQFLVDGFAQAALEENDLLLTDDGKIAILDLGLIVRIAPTMQEKLIQLILSIAEGRADHTESLLVNLGLRREGFDKAAFRRLIASLVLINRDIVIEQSPIGRVFMSIAQAGVRCGIVFPPEVVSFGHVLLNVEGAAHLIDPNFDSHTFVHDNVGQIMKHHMQQALSSNRMIHTVLETAEFLEKLPGRIGQIFDLIAANQLRFTVHAIDEQMLMRGCQKIANRITVGLILAALIVGAANLMHIRTAFTIFGYPGLAMVCFMAAAGLGFVLVLEILISDRRSH